MATFQRPGVFPVEQPSAAQPVNSLSTTTGAMLGIAQRGPANVPVLCGSFMDYTNRFAFGMTSPYYVSGYLAYSVFGFFNNGGDNLYVVRTVAATAAKAAFNFLDTGASNTAVTFSAAAVLPNGQAVDDPGIWGNNVYINLQANATVATNYDVYVYYGGTAASNLVETYKNCSLTTTDPTFMPNMINGISNFVQATKGSGTTVVQATAMGAGIFKQLVGGLDGLPAASDFTTALGYLDSVQNDIWTMGCSDNQSTAFIQAAYAKAQAYNAFFITDGNLNDTVATIQTTRSSLSSMFGSLYFPWIQVTDPISANKNQPVKYVPTVGHIMGTYSLVDNSRGTFKAPAGIIDGQLTGALGVKYVVTPSDEDTLNSNQINIIKSVKGAGVVIWGARTLSADPTYLYIPVRRELSKIERSIRNGTQWAVFEPNTVTTWRKVTNAVNTFLNSEFQSGAFSGIKPDGSDSYYALCDSTTNTPALIAAGQITIQVGVAQAKPGEFVVLNIGQASF